MKRIKVIVKGEVQRVGYRDAVEKIARKLNITGFVENLKPYDVKIIAEGEDENIDAFIKQIQIKKFSIHVESIEVNPETYKGEFEWFEIKRGDWREELFERFDTAGALLYKSVELNEKSVALGEKSVALSEKSVALSEKSVALSEKILEKHDDVIDAIDRNKDDIIDAIYHSKNEVVAEIGSLKKDLNANMNRRFTKIEQDIKEVKSKIRML